MNNYYYDDDFNEMNARDRERERGGERIVRQLAGTMTGRERKSLEKNKRLCINKFEDSALNKMSY